MLIPPALPVYDAHLSVPVSPPGGGPRAVGAARCAGGRRPRRALLSLRNKVDVDKKKSTTGRSLKRFKVPLYRWPIRGLRRQPCRKKEIIQSFLIRPCQVGGDKKQSEKTKSKAQKLLLRLFHFNYSGMKEVKACNRVPALLLVLITAAEGADGATRGQDAGLPSAPSYYHFLLRSC